MSNNRHLSPFDYLEILQEEYICNDIRTKIFIRRADKDHFRRVLENKKQKITSIADKNGLPTILDDTEKYLEYWHRIVPTWGLPRFIYNQPKNTQQNSKFPYKGTLVRYLIEGEWKYGFTIEVDFKNEDIFITPINEKETTQCVYYQDVERLSAEETDRFFYYSTGNTFKLKGNQEVAILHSVDLNTEVARFLINEEEIIISINDISRIL